MVAIILKPRCIETVQYLYEGMMNKVNLQN